MNQIHPKSQTTQILYQEPTQAEMNPSFIQGAISTLQNISLIVVIGAAFIFTSLTIMRGCADDVERQHAMAIKHQIQFGGGK
ncbi:hypothetical protein [Acinetobacter sp. KS-LM10]|uniref:hypothetical protein n=1 Tax=Acinetobacter sp. KS-LM10 TaxID=3120518 RepID=UPI0030CC3FFC